MTSECQVAVKRPRNCELCLQEHAIWYCAADDAFLCHACDVSVHSANQVARKHERVCLGTSGILNSNEIEGATTRPVWHGGFRRKARTPRVRSCKKPLQVQSESQKDERREDPYVPEIGNDGRFLVTEKNDGDLNPLVPDFQGFTEVGFFATHEDADDCFRLHTSGDNGEIGSILGIEQELEEKTSCVDIEEMTADFNSQDGYDVLEKDLTGEAKTEGEKVVTGINQKAFANQILMSCEKDDEKVLAVTPQTEQNVESETNARQRNMFLRLNYEEVMAAWDKHGSPRTIGSQPEFNTTNFRLVHPVISSFSSLISHASSKVLANITTSFGDMITLSREAMIVHRLMVFCQSQLQEICFSTGDKVGGVPEKKGSRCSEREARVWRYKDKRKTRLFKKKIRYEVRKLNADKRPRMKGRFVRRTLVADS